VVFLANYNVSMGQIIIPGADLSEQISTAGTEASGTSNMKFALNGALTIGTLDGANIEIADAVGQENMFIFGLPPQEANAIRRARSQDTRWIVQNDEELRAALTAISGGLFSPTERNRYQQLIENLVAHDEFLVLNDYRAYVDCQDRVADLFRNPDEWDRRAALTVARMGRFSSDRTVLDYAADVWNVAPRAWANRTGTPEHISLAPSPAI
jgi:starch phosphorylase